MLEKAETRPPACWRLQTAVAGRSCISSTTAPWMTAWSCVPSHFLVLPHRGDAVEGDPPSGGLPGLYQPSGQNLRPPCPCEPHLRCGAFLSDQEAQDLTLTDFAASCSQPELVRYLKERRLYVNEPVVVERRCKGMCAIFGLLDYGEKVRIKGTFGCQGRRHPQLPHFLRHEDLPEQRV